MVKQDVDIRTYFLERSPKSGEIIEMFIQNGVETMDDLRAKGDVWLMKTLGMDDRKMAIAEKIIGEYSMTKRRSELLAAEEILLGAYFYEHTPEQYRTPTLIKAVINDLRRAGIESMNALDALTDMKIEHVRNIGPKRRELVLLMRDMYRDEQKRCKSLYKQEEII